jgi:hypothetical protein
MLHLYAIDWDGTSRRQTIYVDDGSGPRSIALSTSFHDGAWLQFSINVAAGGVVTIRADRTGGQSTLSGIFLDGSGGATPTPTPTSSPTVTPSPTATSTPTPSPSPSPSPTPTPTASPSPTPIPGGWTVAPQGDWVGAYGADGYALLAWNKTSDVIVLPNATLTLDQGRRYRWTSSTTSARALENATQTQRRAAQWLDNTSLRLHLTFSSAYTGTLRLYAIDWDGTSRRQIVYVDDGSGARSVSLNTSFHDGAWMAFPISVPAGGTVTIRVDRTANQVTLSGIFLGGS